MATLQFFDNDTTSMGDEGRSFALTNLLFYSDYQFDLVAVYGENDSSIAMDTATTAEGGEQIKKFTAFYCSYILVGIYFLVKGGCNITLQFADFIGSCTHVHAHVPHSTPIHYNKLS